MEELRISFSPHAIDVIEQRDIMIEWVTRALAEPAFVCQDGTDPDLLQASGSVPERAGRILRVVYNPATDSALVVTAFFDRSMKGKL